MSQVETYWKCPKCGAKNPMEENDMPLMSLQRSGISPIQLIYIEAYFVRGSIYIILLRNT